MRDLDRRVKKLEENRVAASPKPIPTLRDFYESYHDPDHPDHDRVRQSLANMYVDLRGGKPMNPALFSI